MSINQSIIAYFVANHAIILIIACVGNVLAGSAEAWKDNAFKLSVFLTSVKDLCLLAVGYISFGVFAYSVKDITFQDIQVFSGLFAFITVIIVLIKGNSLAMHFITLAKIPTPAVMTAMDDKVKEYLNKAKPDFLGMTEDEV